MDNMSINFTNLEDDLNQTIGQIGLLSEQAIAAKEQVLISEDHLNYVKAQYYIGMRNQTNDKGKTFTEKEIEAYIITDEENYIPANDVLRQARLNYDAATTRLRVQEKKHSALSELLKIKSVKMLKDN